MKKIIICLVFITLMLSACQSKPVSINETTTTLNITEIETKHITSGEIKNLSQIDGKYVVMIAEYDEVNKCSWINSCEVSEKEFNGLVIDQQYTIKN